MLEVMGLESGYGLIQVLNQLSIRVETGQVVSVVGSNGAGKTTLLRTIAGLVRTTAGSIRVSGTAVEHLPAYRRAELGVTLVPEGRQLFPYMTVRENLLVAATLRRSRLKRNRTLSQVCELFPVLADRMDQLAGTLSGGEQQMVALGRGLMALPDVLLLDEPSLGLAPIVVREIFHAIRKLHQEGYTILLVEQNLHLALGVSDYAYVLENGAVTMEGTRDQVMNNEYTRQAYIGV